MNHKKLALFLACCAASSAMISCGETNEWEPDVTSCINGRIDCKDSAVVYCVEGQWTVLEPCQYGCDDVRKVCATQQPTTCTDADNKCVDNVLTTCHAGRLVTTNCAYGQQCGFDANNKPACVNVQTVITCDNNGTTMNVGDTACDAENNLLTCQNDGQISTTPCGEQVCGTNTGKAACQEPEQTVTCDNNGTTMNVGDTACDAENNLLTCENDGQISTTPCGEQVCGTDTGKATCQEPEQTVTCDNNGTTMNVGDTACDAEENSLLTCTEDGSLSAAPCENQICRENGTACEDYANCDTTAHGAKICHEDNIKICQDGELVLDTDCVTNNTVCVSAEGEISCATLSTGDCTIPTNIANNQTICYASEDTAAALYTCKDGETTSVECEANPENNEIAICNPEDNTLCAVTCKEGFTMDEEGYCVECESGAYRCEDGKYQFCYWGSWTEADDCANFNFTALEGSTANASTFACNETNDGCIIATCIEGFMPNDTGIACVATETGNKCGKDVNGNDVENESFFCVTETTFNSCGFNGELEYAEAISCATGKVCNPATINTKFTCEDAPSTCTPVCADDKIQACVDGVLSETPVACTTTVANAVGVCESATACSTTAFKCLDNYELKDGKCVEKVTCTPVCADDKIQACVDGVLSETPVACPTTVANAVGVCESATACSTTAFKCLDNYELKDGKCVEKQVDACEPGTYRCNASVREKCSDTNTWVTDACAVVENATVTCDAKAANYCQITCDSLYELNGSACTLKDGNCLANADCASQSTKKVCDTAKNACVECLNDSDCSDGKLCASNVCTAPVTVCEKDKVTCSGDKKSVLTCNSLGTSNDVTDTCDASETCIQTETGASCEPVAVGECTTGETKCEDGQSYTCTDGEWGTGTACPTGNCNGNSCETVACNFQHMEISADDLSTAVAYGRVPKGVAVIGGGLYCTDDLSIPMKNWKRSPARPVINSECTNCETTDEYMATLSLEAGSYYCTFGIRTNDKSYWACAPSNYNENPILPNATYSADDLLLTADNTRTLNITCGNGSLDSGEQCDGSVPSEVTCASQLGESYVSGAVTCNSACKFDTTNCAEAGSAITLAAWNFDDSNVDIDEGPLSSSTFGLSVDKKIDWNNGTAGKAAASQAGWSTADAPDYANDPHWTINLNTTGYEDIQISFAFAGSGDKNKSIALAYKVGDGAFEHVGEDMSTTTKNFQNYPETALTNAANKESVTIGIFPYKTASGMNIRIDDIVITGKAMK